MDPDDLPVVPGDIPEQPIQLPQVPNNRLAQNHFPNMDHLATAFNHLAEQLKNNNKNLEIDNFSGKPGTFNTFLQKILAYCEITNKDEQEKLNYFTFLLKGRAFEFFTNLPDETRKDFDQTITALRNHFSPPNCELLDSAQCFSLKMRENENVSIFYERLIKSSNRLTLTDRNKMLIFINGLVDEIREFIVLQQPESMEEALKLAKTKESVSLRSTTGDTLKKILHKIENVSNLEQNQPNDEVAFLRKKIKKLEHALKDAHISIDKNKNSHPDFRNNRMPNTSTQDRFRNETIRCFACNKTGHFMRDCRSQHNSQQTNSRNQPTQNYSKG